MKKEKKEEMVTCLKEQLPASGTCRFQIDEGTNGRCPLVLSDEPVTGLWHAQRHEKHGLRLEFWSMACTETHEKHGLRLEFWSMACTETHEKQRLRLEFWSMDWHAQRHMKNMG